MGNYLTETGARQSGRAYLSSTCGPSGSNDHSSYAKFNLLEKRFPTREMQLSQGGRGLDFTSAGCAFGGGSGFEGKGETERPVASPKTEKPRADTKRARGPSESRCFASGVPASASSGSALLSVPYTPVEIYLVYLLSILAFNISPHEIFSRIHNGKTSATEDTHLRKVKEQGGFLDTNIGP